MIATFCYEEMYSYHKAKGRLSELGLVGGSFCFFSNQPCLSVKVFVS